MTEFTQHPRSSAAPDTPPKALRDSGDTATTVATLQEADVDATFTTESKTSLIRDVRGMEFVEKLVAFLFVVVAVIGLMVLANAVKEKFEEQGETVKGLDTKIEIPQ